MQIEYRLSLKDYQEANRTYLKLKRSSYFSFWFAILVGLFFLIISLPFLLFNTFTMPRDNWLLICFLFSIYALSLPIIFFNPYFSNPITTYFINRVWKGLPNLHHPIRVEVNEEILKFKTINSESITQWQLYTKAVETKNLFMLYRAKTVFYMIPKRAFDSDEPVDEFRELLRNNIEKFSKV